MSVFEEVRNIIVEIKDIPETDITMESNLAEDLDTDSLDVVEMLMALEEKFSIQIPEDDAAKMETVKDVVDYIEKKL